MEFASGTVVKQVDRDKKREESPDEEEGSTIAGEGSHNTAEERQSKKVLETNIDALDTSETDQQQVS